MDKAANNCPEQGFSEHQALKVLEGIINHTPLLMCYINSRLEYVLASSTLREKIGLPPDKLIGTRVRSPFSGGREPIRSLLKEVFRTGKPATRKAFQFPLKNKLEPGISNSFWDFTFTPVMNGPGQVMGVLGLFEDVTELVTQKRLLEEVATLEQQKAAQLMAVLEGISEGISVIDQTGKLILANRVAARFYGEEMMGKIPNKEGVPDYKRFHLDGTPLLPEESTSARVLRGEKFTDFRYGLINYRGERFILSTNGSPIYAEKGELLGGVFLFRDISEQERHREELVENQNTLLEMASAAAGITNLGELLNRIVRLVSQVTGCDRVGISLYDPVSEEVSPGAVYGFNPVETAEWLSSPPAPRNRNFPWDKLIYEDFQPQVIDYEALQIKTRGEGVELPNPYGVKTAFFMALAFKGEPIGLLSVDHAGKPHHFKPNEIRILEGIGRLAAIAIQNVKLVAEANQAIILREANRLKDEFLSLVAHDLRTPLAAIQGYSQLTQRKMRKLGIGEADLKPLETIIGQSQRMTRLVDDLLDLSRIETGRLEIRLESGDLLELVERTLASFIDNNTEHSFTFDLPQDSNREDFKGNFDCDRLEQVLYNLLSNAVKYSPSGGEITLKLEKEKGDPAFLNFSITDHGIGIPAGQEQTLFERFTRTSNSRDSGLPGLGLGLYISSRIIALHGGQIRAESPGVGQGSIFHFNLPVNMSHPEF